MKLNKYQANLTAKRTALGKLLEQRMKIEKDYIQTNNIVNKDGVVPAVLWLIDDDDVFKKAVDEIGCGVDELGIPEARKAVEAAEDDLIKYGLSIMPVYLNKERQILENACFGLNGYSRNITTRLEMIKITLNFDTSKIPEWARRAAV